MTGWLTLRRNPTVRGLLLFVMALMLLALLMLNMVSGAVEVDSDVAFKAMQDELGLTSNLNYEDRLVNRDALLIRKIRFPRAAMAGLVGAGLALAGAALQGVFRNPLADPGLIGVSSGAALGAVMGILLGINSSVPITAFIGGLLMTLLVYRLAYRREYTDSTALLLIGLAINAIVSAFVGTASFVSQATVGDITFWTLGTIGGTDWEEVMITLLFVGVGIVILPLQANRLNLMALGENQARHLGVNVERLRLIIIGLSALMVSVATAFVGIIGFVGLFIPHLIRLLFGPDHRLLLPASALGGAIFLMGFDLIARTVAEPTEVPIGVLTTLVGGPFFLFLILINRRRI